MIKDRYNLTVFGERLAFKFESIGAKGAITKWVAFGRDKDKEDYYHLAFGDYIDGVYYDDTISGNNDARKVLATVLYAMSRFFETYPTASVEIEGVDERRQRLYNSIISHKLQALLAVYRIKGEYNGTIELVETGKSYTYFIIQWVY